MLLQDVQIFLSDCRLKTVEIWDIWQLNNEKTKVSQQIVRVPKEQMGRRNVQDKQQFCPCFLQKRVCIAIYLFAILDIVAEEHSDYSMRRTDMRQEILLNEEWYFHRGDLKTQMPYWKGPVYSQSKTERKQAGPAAYHYEDRPDQYLTRSGMLNHERWECVTIPHDYVVDQDLDENENNALGYLRYDNAWYRKHFKMPEGLSDKRVTLRFDGIAGTSVIYLNGSVMYHNYSRYNSFEIDISDYVFYDKDNVIAVYVNTEEFEGWWYQGGGIYRDVHLTITERLAIDLWGVYAPTRKIDNSQWAVDLETTVVNDTYEESPVTVKSILLDRDGTQIAQAEATCSIAPREKHTVPYCMSVQHPELWDCENPYLYTVRTALFRGDEQIDRYDTRIGFRTVEISVESGLLLNGKKTFINGVCAHQDYGITGLAVPDNVARYKMQLIKEMGANGYRTSHYQQTAAYLDAADELGILVMDEARWFESTKEALEQVEVLVKRDRNRPSVIMWSTGNEEPYFITEQGRNIHKAIAAHIRKFDKTRYITAAQDREPEKSTVYADCDIIGINYNLHQYESVHQSCPDKAIFASECCATGTTRDWNFNPSGNTRLRDHDRDANAWFLGRERTRKFLASKPYVFGSFQWAAVEHRGEASWPAICSKSGALDLFLKKKGAFYQNQSHWLEEPMVHIVPHWNFEGLEGKEILVTVYTNCEELELFLNGSSQGRNAIEKYGHGEWNVPYEKGELLVKGYRNGCMVAQQKKETTGKPVALKLTLDNSFEANGTDLALFTCECVDGEGRVVPDAAEYVRFSAANPAVIVGTGSDHCDHNRVGAAQRKMYMGKITVAVRPAKGQEHLELLAQSDSLRPALYSEKIK